MRLPSGSQGRVFKCVACGALVERDGVISSAPGAPAVPAEERSGEESADSSEHLMSLFVEKGLISKEQARLAQSEHLRGREKIFETLLRLEMITKEQLHTMLSREPGTATINLAHFTIDSHLAELLPSSMVLKHWVLPIDRLGRSVTIAMVCPVDMEAIATVESQTNLRVRPMLCSMGDFLEAACKHYRLDELEEDVESLANVTLLRREGVDAGARASQRPEDTHADGIQGSEPVTGTQSAVAPAAPGKSVVAAYAGRDLDDALSQLTGLAIPARILNQVDAVVGAESEGLRQVVCAVGGSPPFVANVLCTANSIAYGLSGSVDSIPMAVALLSGQAVAVLAANAPKMSPNQERQWHHLTQYLRHSAEIAAILALDCGRIVPNVAYCAGLLHSVGSYALGEVAPDEYHRIDPHLVGAARLHAESQIFGMNHVEAGALLCKAWNLPEVLREALQNYPTPEAAREYQDIANTVFIASRVASPDGKLNRARLPECQHAFKALDIDSNSVLTALENTTIGTVEV